MTTTTRTTRQSLGVTLIEMMVALAITTLVVLVINQLFNQVVQTVARGTQGGEMLQKSRTIDEQLARETELSIIDAQNPEGWLSRMVGPAGRYGKNDADGPGGFLVVVQHTVDAPLTLEEQIQSQGTVRQTIRSDQLMFVYDQDSPLDSGTKRLPALAPSSRYNFTGDQRDSLYAEYARIWYGHVLQIPDGRDPETINVANSADYNNFDLGISNAANPNAIAQDWVLGRHALLLTDSLPTSASDISTLPYGPYVNGTSVAAASVMQAPSGTTRLGNGLCDVANFSLEHLIIERPPASVTADHLPMAGLNSSPTYNVFQGSVLFMSFASTPLLTSAKPLGSTNSMRAWDNSPSHTYFMGGVSDFIVEWAGDLADGVFNDTIPPGRVNPDGELDRDSNGNIKWYTSPAYANHPAGGAYTFNAPITYPAPPPNQYTPTVNPALLAGFPRASNAYVWQTEGSPGFTQWPWMLRIRYRLHDRRGEFEGREMVVNNSTGQTVPEKGQWYEVILPVNWQGLQ